MGGQASKIAFRRSIFRLLRDAHIDANDHEYWPMYWGFSATLEDICTLLSNDDVRRIRDSEPANLTTLGRVLMRHVIDVVNNNSFPADLRLYQECRSCLLILSKLIPIIYELPDEKLEIDIFWQNVGEDGDGLGLSLIRVLHSLLFMPGFTIPASSSGSQVWTAGIGCNSSLQSNLSFTENRIIIIRTFMALCSKDMYRHPDDRYTYRALDFVLGLKDRKMVLNLLCSLLNTPLSQAESGWKSSYNNFIAPHAEAELNRLCLQFLLILSSQPMDLSTSLTDTNNSLSSTNQFRSFLGRIHRGSDFQVIIDGIERILSEPLNMGIKSYLPRYKNYICSAECLQFLWILTNLNGRFTEYLASSRSSLDLTLILLYYITTNSRQAHQINIIRMALNIILTWTCHSDYCEMLNVELVDSNSLPSSLSLPNFLGCYADFIIIQFHAIIVAKGGILHPLFESMFSILANISPYLKKASVATAAKLSNLFALISSPMFLYANENHPRLLELILQTINVIIEKNFAANPNIVYAVLRYHKLYQTLFQMTFESGAMAMTSIEDSSDSVTDTEAEQFTEFRSKASADSRRNSSSILQTNDGTTSKVSIDSDTEATDKEQAAVSGSTMTTAAADDHSKGPGTDTDSLQTQITDNFGGYNQHLSEKARGKLPQGRYHEDYRFEHSSIRKNAVKEIRRMDCRDIAFTPSERWFESWHSKLDMNTIMLIIEQYLPHMKKQLAENDGDYKAVFDYFKAHAPVGLSSGEFVSHSFFWTPENLVWFQSLIWGYIYASDSLSCGGAGGIWTGTRVRRFRVEQAPREGPSLRKPYGAIDAMAQTIWDKFGGLSTTDSRNIRNSSEVFTALHNSTGGSC